MWHIAQISKLQAKLEKVSKDFLRDNTLTFSLNVLLVVHIPDALSPSSDKGIADSILATFSFYLKNLDKIETTGQKKRKCSKFKIIYFF